MKNLKSYCILVLGLWVGTNGNAQQTSLNTLYNQNNYLINPAAVGLNNCFSAYLNHRNQWLGINNSPVRNAFTVDGRLAGAHGVGLDTRMYQAGLLKNFNVKLTYAYHLKVAEKAKLSFGISLGLIQQSFAFSEAIVTDYTDNLLVGGNQADMGFSSDAGLLLSAPRFRFGISIPQVFSRGLITESGGAISEFKLVQHYLIHGSFDVVSTEKWRLTPTVLYKNAALVGHQVDLGVRGVWKNTIGVGAMYRTSYGLVGMVDLNLKDKFRLAYGYGFGGGNLSGLTSGSHEIMLGIQLCRKEKPIVEDVVGEIVEEVVVDTVAEIAEEIVDTPVEDTVENQKDEVVHETKVLDLDSLNKTYGTLDKLILYNLNSADEVTSTNRDAVVKETVEILTQNPDVEVLIVGHTCNMGSTDYNKEIGLKRAADIKSDLVKAGISSSRIKVDSKGESQPFLPNTSESNQQKNRRVQVVFLK